MGYERKLLVISKRYFFADPPEVRAAITAIGPAVSVFDAVLYFTRGQDLGYIYETDANTDGEIIPLTGSDWLESRE